MHRRERVIVEDVANSPLFAGTPALEVMLAAKARAVQSTPLVTRSGRMIGMFSTHYHTAHQPTERELQMLDLLARQAADLIERTRDEEQVRLAIEAAPSAMLMVDQEGKMVLVNSQAEKYFGYTRDELLGKSVEMLIPIRFRGSHPRYRAEFFGTPQVRRMGAGRDLFGLRKDGSEFPIEIGLNPIRTADGAMVLSAIVDITERKRAEEQLRESAMAIAFANESLKGANAELRRQNVELDEFTAVASHDLQEPLRKIIAFGDLLPKDLGDDIPETARQDLGFITDAAKRMRVLIQDLLALSRAGRVALEREPVSLNDCVANAMGALSDRIEKTGAEIARDELPNILGDATQLTQLYQNLIANALKFSVPGRRPEIHLTCEPQNGEVVLGVRDNGIGIKAEYHEQIFAPFKRLHRRDKFDGTGIGLSICRKAVERHGGRIWVESQPDQGAHFRFTLNAISENTAWLHGPEGRPSSSSPRMTPAIKS